MNGEADGARPWWDPVAAWEQMAGPGRPGGDSWSPGWGPRNPLQLLVDGVRSGLVGRPVELGAGTSRVAFTLTSLEASVGHLAAAAGQADAVSIAVENAEWRAYRLAAISARLHNVHTRVRDRPVVVSAPVDVSVVLSHEELRALVAVHLPVVTVEVTGAAELLVRPARRPGWGYVVVRPGVEDGALVLRLGGGGRGARRWRLGRPVVTLRPKVRLPDGMRFTGIEVRAGRVDLHLRADELRLDHRDLAALVRKQASVPSTLRSGESDDASHRH